LNYNGNSMFFELSAGNNLRFKVQNTSSTNIIDATCTGFALPLNTWSHITVTLDGTNAYFYNNGAQIPACTTARSAGTVFNTPGQLYFGELPGGARLLQGSMDEVRIYNRALQPSEISTLYQSGSAKTKAPSNLGLLGYWSMEDGRGDKVTDFSGRGNTGTLTNFALSTTTSNWNSGAQCARGACLNFDGANDYVTSTASGIANLSAFTVSTWFKTTTTANSDMFSNGSSASLGPYIRITINRFAATGRVTFELRDDAGASPIAISTNAYNDGNWHHAVAVRNTNTDHKLYIDGVQVGSDVATTIGATTVDRQCIGVLCRTSNSAYFTGSIDEVRVYSRALSPAEITSLYGSGVAKINVSRNNKVTNGLVGLWSFDGPDLTTATATDRSGSGLDGTRMGGISPTIGKIGQGMNLDGGDDYIAVPSVINSRASSSFSVSLWTKNNVSPGQYDGIISETDGGGWHYGFGMYYDSATQLNFFVDLWSLNFVTSTINPLEWNHIVGTWDGTTMHLYVNGVLSPSTDTYTGGPIAQVYPFEIGRVGDNAYNINGKIDDVRVYNRALTQSEITELYNLGR
jgi:hypothetical protein